MTKQQDEDIEQMAKYDDPYATGAGDAHYREIVRKGGGELPPIVKWTVIVGALLFVAWLASGWFR